jgi:response regulator NasT
LHILFTSDGQALGAAVMRSLRADQGLIVNSVDPDTLPEAVAGQVPDVLVAAARRPGPSMLACMLRALSVAPFPVVLFLESEACDFMERAIRAGISLCSVPGNVLPPIRPVLHGAAIWFRYRREMLEKLGSAEGRLREADMIRRAKARLMKERRLSEPEAYHWLRRQAMATGRRIAEVAAELSVHDLGNTT